MAPSMKNSHQALASTQMLVFFRRPCAFCEPPPPSYECTEWEKVLRGDNFRAPELRLSVNSDQGFTFIKNGPGVLYVTISLLIMFGVPRCTVFQPPFFRCKVRRELGFAGIYTHRPFDGASAIRRGRNPCTFIKTIQGLNVW